MKNLIKILFLCGIIALMASRCEKNEDKSIPVEFKFRLLDTLGNEKTAFNYGENIIFSFLVINKSSEDLMLENFFPNDDFFRVYQNNTNEGTLNYGLPYDAICEIGYFTIPANDILELKCPWVSSDNSYYYHNCLLTDKELHDTFIPVGNFYTNFKQSFKIGNIQTEEKHFKINFTVK